MNEDFRTFYFKPGFESLVPLVNYIEDQFKVMCGVGSDFINVYTTRPELVKRIELGIRRWNSVDKNVQLDPKEHGE